MNYELTISTECCELAKTHKVVFLYFKRSFKEYQESFLRFKPIWVSNGFEYHKLADYMTQSLVQVNNCPFCGSRVPEIELNKIAIDNHLIHDSVGDYCRTCDKRNNECECLPPVFRWKPIGIELTIPKIDEDVEV